jgi:16S rRNA (guanine(966)-N(2))-methyltransferase RsmD
VRVIGGKIKGRKIKTCRGKFLRPTSEKIREAIFNIISPFLTDGLVLDLFAGTGSLGIEALSRGMGRAVFIENNTRVISILKENIISCQLENQAEVIVLPVTKGLKILRSRKEKFKLIFLDPPYLSNLAGRTILEISEANILEKDGLVIVEHSSREDIKSNYGNLIMFDQRQYGQTLVSFFHY